MQRALGASEPPGLPMMKPSPSKEVPATTHKKETTPSVPQEEIPQPGEAKKDLVNIATAKETPALIAPAKKVTATATSLPDKTDSSAVTKMDVSPVPQKPPAEVPKQQPSAPQQQAPKVQAPKPAAPQEAGKQPLQQPPKPETSPAKSVPSLAQPAKESGGFFGFGANKTQPAAAKPAESVTGKMFGFGSSFLSSASTLISSAIQDETTTTPPTPRKMSTTASVTPKTTPPASPKTLPAKDTKPPPVQITEVKKLEKPQQDKTPATVQAKGDKAPSELPKVPTDNKGASQVTPSICPLCKVKLNMEAKDPSNYNICTECKTTVCNQCGFNPKPNMSEVKVLPTL